MRIKIRIRIVTKKANQVNFNPELTQVFINQAGRLETIQTS